MSSLCHSNRILFALVLLCLVMGLSVWVAILYPYVDLNAQEAATLLDLHEGGGVAGGGATSTVGAVVIEDAERTGDGDDGHSEATQGDSSSSSSLSNNHDDNHVEDAEQAGDGFDGNSAATQGDSGSSSILSNNHDDNHVENEMIEDKGSAAAVAVVPDQNDLEASCAGAATVACATAPSSCSLIIAPHTHAHQVQVMRNPPPAAATGESNREKGDGHQDLDTTHVLSKHQEPAVAATQNAPDLDILLGGDSSPASGAVAAVSDSREEEPPPPTCLSLLRQADRDANDLLNRAEYAALAARLLRGAAPHLAVADRYAALPFPVKMNFVHLHCVCAECCAEEDGIYIGARNSGATVDGLCAQTTAAIGRALAEGWGGA